MAWKKRIDPMDPMPTFAPGDEALADDLNTLAAAIDVVSGTTTSVARRVDNIGPMPWTFPSTGRVPMPIANSMGNVPGWATVTDAANGRVLFNHGGLVYIAFGCWGVTPYFRMRNQVGAQIAGGLGSGSNIIQIATGDTLYLEVEATAGDVLQDVAWSVLDLRVTV